MLDILACSHISLISNIEIGDGHDIASPSSVNCREFLIRLMPALARLGRKHPRAETGRTGVSQCRQLTGAAMWYRRLGTGSSQCRQLTGAAMCGIVASQVFRVAAFDSCASQLRSRLTHWLCAGCLQPLGCPDREPQWVDLLYEPALGSFLEWHPVATFFGAYIKLLRQVRARLCARPTSMTAFVPHDWC